jgi:hypothetical protein
MNNQHFGGRRGSKGVMDVFIVYGDGEGGHVDERKGRCVRMIFCVPGGKAEKGKVGKEGCR